MEKCDEKYYEDLLLGYFTRELTPEQEKELLDWLEQDPSHKDKLSQMADGWAAAHIPLFMANMRSDCDGFFEQRSQKDHPGRKSRVLSWMSLKKVAAAILVLISVGSVSYYFGEQRRMDEIAEFMKNQQISSEVTTPMGSTSKVLLPDGSLAIVNAGTTLTYKYNYAERIREIHLDGEAYFDVVRDEEHPFVVKTNNLDIKVLGTTFNMKSYSNDPETKIALITGSVNVKVNPQDNDAMDFTLSPDKMLTYDKISHNVGISEFRERDILAWTTGRLKFENLPFPHIVKDLERKFDVQIRIESERLKKDVFSGSFSSNYSLEQIFKEVDIEKRYKWIQKQDEIIIRDR